MADEVKKATSIRTLNPKKHLLLQGLTSIGGIEITADTQDVTTLDSDGGYREFIRHI